MNDLHTTTPVQDDPWAASTAQDAPNPMHTPSADAAVDDPWAASSVQADAPTANATDAGTDPWGGSAGAPDAGIRTILDMVTLTRLDCALASAGIMRASMAEAVHHVRGRSVFGKKLIDQPLMGRRLDLPATGGRGLAGLADRLGGLGGAVTSGSHGDGFRLAARVPVGAR